MGTNTTPGADLEIRVGPPIVVVHSDDQFVVSDPDGRINPACQHGFFAADTRLVSRHEIEINASTPTLLNSAPISAYSARYELTNPELITSQRTVPKHVVHLRVDRVVGRGVHEDYDIVNYDDTEIDLMLEITIESDFADLFDVKANKVVRRGSHTSQWNDDRLDTRYRNGSFRRGVRIQVANSTSRPEYADGKIGFRVSLAPKAAWHACVYWLPLLGDDDPAPPEHSCHELVTGSPTGHEPVDGQRGCTRFDTNDEGVTSVVARAIRDLTDLRLRRYDSDLDDADPSAWTISAGVPWFVTLFGRDSTVVALQTLALSPRFARGTLRALARLQGESLDDWRDLQPGKVEHEIRHGELATLRLVPQVPYYGTHDATTLYVLAVARAFPWHGDVEALDELRPSVERALVWIDRYGDSDGDGLQEYQTRSADGMYNQGWKDSGESIVHADGTRAPLPIATCELQGYVVAAKRAWADVLDDVYREGTAAASLRDSASRLADQIEQRFWWEEEGTYYLGLDGNKRPIASVTSNPGHLLWSRSIDAARATRVAERLCARNDMWSGWGVRTMSSDHVSYNPFSYQRGAVWPHDNAVLVEGLCHYGEHDAAGRVARAIFDAANCFQHRRLPEAFSGVARDAGSFPSQYLGANVPQAWASGSTVQMLTALLGLEADAPSGLIRLAPHLPDWLTSVRIEQLCVGQASVDLSVRRRRDGACQVLTERNDSGVTVEVVTSTWNEASRR